MLDDFAGNDADLALEVELEAIAQGVPGIEMGVHSALSRHHVDPAVVRTFLRHTPGGKKGIALWKEFTRRRDLKARKAKKRFIFADFICDIAKTRGVMSLVRLPK